MVTIHIALADFVSLIVAIVGMLYLYRICRPLNVYRGIVYFGCFAALVVCFVFLRAVFSLVNIVSPMTLEICAGLRLLAWPLLEFTPKLMKKWLEKLAIRLAE